MYPATSCKEIQTSLCQGALAKRSPLITEESKKPKHAKIQESTAKDIINESTDEWTTVKSILVHDQKSPQNIIPR
jgi:hypothetical protein